MKLPKKRTGAILIFVLIALLIGGVIAARLIPDYNTIQTRGKEVNLGISLGQIRQAFDMAYAPDTGASQPPDIGTSSAEIEALLKGLSQEGYLSTYQLRDPSIPAYRWGTGPSDVYWRITRNFALQNSFENQLTTSWEKDSQTTATTTDTYYPNSDGLVDDQYNSQNALGLPWSSHGSSYVITK